MFFSRVRVCVCGFVDGCIHWVWFKLKAWPLPLASTYKQFTKRRRNNKFSERWYYRITPPRQTVKTHSGFLAWFVLLSVLILFCASVSAILWFLVICKWEPGTCFQLKILFYFVFFFPPVLFYSLKLYLKKLQRLLSIITNCGHLRCERRRRRRSKANIITPYHGIFLHKIKIAGLATLWKNKNRTTNENYDCTFASLFATCT